MTGHNPTRTNIPFKAKKMTPATGFTLIEVLLSLFILSLCLLGLDAMQLSALHAAKNAYDFSVAAAQISNMHERMLALNNQSFTQELEKWNQQNHSVLLKGQGWIKGHYPHYHIILSWQEQGKKNYHQLSALV
jgi:prepilin-type N-terminal cleavage/methylation domain-containing protein